ncbi:hypothetical protein L3Q82_014178%2C partial [Xyrichtys novacula]|uniref:Cytochrome P450 n=1 Tax=Xyrichtys novacula TaxID=13765 RepID=A0AAV1GP47_XYRNO|nr:hypothetical protein L3Q82_014178%2C partial [Xyrichtys novacula]
MSLMQDLVYSLFSNPTTLLGAAALLLLLCFLVSGSTNTDETRKELPGPKPLPLIGNLLQLDLKRPFETLYELSKTYGSVFTVYFGPNKVVVLAGYKTVKEALVGHADEFGERHIFPIFYDTNQGHGIVFANGDSWKELRRFALTTLKDFGMGKKIAEERILEECHHLIRVFEQHEGKPFNTSRPMNHATSNVISSIVYGSRFEYDDPRFKCMVKTANHTISIVGSAQIQLFNMFPRLFCWIKNRQQILRNTETLVQNVKGLLKDLTETLSPQICRGLVDCFLIRKQKDEDSHETDSFYNEKNLIFTITNLFAAGTDTTATTLRWGFLFMAKYPHIQEKVHEELSRVVGNREIRVDDRKNLPYTDAVIHETQRLANIVPMNLPHQTSQDVTFQGHFIKKDLVSLIFSSPTTLLGAAALLLLLSFLVSSNLNADGRKEPPGPTPLPLIGNLLQIDLKKPYQTLIELSKKYGSVFTVHLGLDKVVVLTGYKTVKEALVGHAEEFGERHIFPVFYDISQGHGIIFSNGDSWKELRRFALTTLRDFGMGKKTAEERILEECQHLIQVFEEHKGKPFDTLQPMNHAISNVICYIVYGNRFEYDDPRFERMVQLANENVRIAGSAQIQLYNMFPRLLRWINNRRLALRNNKMVVGNVKELTKNLIETLSPQLCRGVVDCFLLRKQKDEKSSDKDSFYNEKNLIYTVMNLFVAGTDTTSTTLRWSFLFMAKYPHMQEKVHEELSRVVGNREVRVEDRKNLPYTDAVIHETQRLANIVPMNLPHQTSRDITFQGHFIKKGTIVFPLLSSVLHDESEWETPLTFNPSHFLDKDGKFMKRDAFMPFSAGRRMCLGESLAKMELFLFFTSVLQQFKLTPAPGVKEEDLDLTPVLGLTLNPSPHELCAVSRHKEPPGPRPLPLIGNSLLLDKKSPHGTLNELSKKYGRVFTFHFGPRKTVVLAGHKIIKQALVHHDAFSEREVLQLVRDMNLTNGILFANGPSWKEMRHFSLTNMRDFGMGKKACEEKIIEESQRLIDLLSDKKGEAFDPACPVNHAVSNIICSIVYGSRFEYDDPVFISMVDIATTNTKLLGSSALQLYNFFPRLFRWLGAHKQLMENIFSNRTHIKELIKGLKDTLNPQMCRGVVDAFLVRKMKLEASGNMESHYHDENLLMTVSNLFSAGTDTTSSTLRYGLLLMAKCPKIQDRVQEEMDRVIGGRQAQVEDRKNLPYTDAVIHEIQRLSCIAPMAGHRTTRDVVFQDYLIKKGTPVLVLLSSALFDEDEWETPNTFNPAHFLDKDGNFTKRDAFLPFSAGARVCAGESLARMELFLFFTSLLQRLRFTPPPGVKEDDLDLTQLVGVTLSPVPHKLCAISRI